MYETTSIRMAEAQLTRRSEPADVDLKSTPHLERNLNKIPTWLTNEAEDGSHKHQTLSESPYSSMAAGGLPLPFGGTAGIRYGVPHGAARRFGVLRIGGIFTDGMWRPCLLPGRYAGTDGAYTTGCW